MSTDSNLSVGSIFYTLLQKRQLKSDSDEYRQLRKDDEKRSQLDEMADDFDCSIAWYPSAVYLIPNQTNSFLGFSRTDMRAKFSEKSGEHLSLRYFIILVLLLNFYDAQTSNHKVRSFIQLSELIKETGNRLKEAAKLEEESQSELNTYRTLLKAYENLSGEVNHSRSSKFGLFRKVILFLCDQKLITIDSDDQIRTLPMLDDKVDYMLRNDQYRDQFDALSRGEYNA